MDIKYLQFRHPHNHQIVGPSSSGKTMRVRLFLEDWEMLCHGFNTKILNVLWLYNNWQPLYTREISPTVNVTYVKGLVDESYFEENKDK